MTDAKEQVLKICEILYDKKALNIRALNVADKTIIAEWFVVCSGRATTQVRTLCATSWKIRPLIWALRCFARRATARRAG